MRGLRRGNGLYIPLVMIYLGRIRVMNKQKKKKNLSPPVCRSIVLWGDTTLVDRGDGGRSRPVFGDDAYIYQILSVYSKSGPGLLLL